MQQTRLSPSKNGNRTGLMSEKMAKVYTKGNVVMCTTKEHRQGLSKDIRKHDEKNVVKTIPNMAVYDDLETWFERLKSGFRNTEYRDMLFLNKMLTEKETQMARNDDKQFWKTILGCEESDDDRPSESRKMKFFSTDDPFSTNYVDDVKQEAHSKENIVQCTCWRYSTLLKSE